MKKNTAIKILSSWFLPSLLIVIFLQSGCKKDEGTTEIKDIDGNIYTSVIIGAQEWMVENLKVTRLNDGTAITKITDESTWFNTNTSAYCWYNNDEAANKNLYGALYTWYAVTSEKLCPKGWHVPSEKEWTILTSYLGGMSLAGNDLKEAGSVHWLAPNDGASNKTGFTALPGGSRFHTGSFGTRAYEGFFWSSTNTSDNTSYSLDITYYWGKVTFHNDFWRNGVSVRCLKN